MIPKNIDHLAIDILIKFIKPALLNMTNTQNTQKPCLMLKM